MIKTKEKQRNAFEEQKKNDLYAKYWSRKTNPTIASWMTSFSKDEIKIVKKTPEPIKTDKLDEEKEKILRKNYRQLLDVDLEYSRNKTKWEKLGVSKDSYRTRYFTTKEILEITTYQEQQNQIKNPSFWSSPIKALTKQFKKKPTSEERHRKEKEIKDHYRKNYGLKK